MTAYALVKLVHVMVSVLGFGLVTATAIVAARSRAPERTVSIFVVLASAALAVVLVTGGALDLLTAGGFRGLWWFRIAVLSMIPAGAALGLSRRFAKRWIAGDERARSKLIAASFVACALVAWITALMELRPFG
jgi:hypothetical protein